MHLGHCFFALFALAFDAIGQTGGMWNVLLKPLVPGVRSSIYPGGEASGRITSTNYEYQIRKKDYEYRPLYAYMKYEYQVVKKILPLTAQLAHVGKTLLEQHRSSDAIPGNLYLGLQLPCEEHTQAVDETFDATLQRQKYTIFCAKVEKRVVDERQKM